MVQRLLGSTRVIILLSTLTYGGTCLPNSMYSKALTHAAVTYQVFHYSIIYLSHWRLEEAPWRNCLQALRYCLSRRLSRMAPGQNCLRISVFLLFWRQWLPIETFHSESVMIAFNRRSVWLFVRRNQIIIDLVLIHKAKKSESFHTSDNSTQDNSS